MTSKGGNARKSIIRASSVKLSWRCLNPQNNLGIVLAFPLLLSNRKWQFQLQLASMYVENCSTNQEKQQMSWSTQVPVCTGSGGWEIAHFSWADWFSETNPEFWPLLFNAKSLRVRSPCFCWDNIYRGIYMEHLLYIHLTLPSNRFSTVLFCSHYRLQ